MSNVKANVIRPDPPLANIRDTISIQFDFPSDFEPFILVKMCEIWWIRKEDE